ncbi:hypothetical protein IWZ01DRAFT_116462 [Phyllosticta capitalensis]
MCQDAQQLAPPPLRTMLSRRTGSPRLKASASRPQSCEDEVACSRPPGQTSKTCTPQQRSGLLGIDPTTWSCCKTSLVESKKRRPSRHCGNCCSDTRTRDSTTTRAVWLAEAHLDCFWPPRRGLGCARVHALGELGLDLAALLYAISALLQVRMRAVWLVTQPATRFSPAPVPQSCFCPGSWEQVDLIAAHINARPLARLKGITHRDN